MRTKQMRTLLNWNEVFLIRGKNSIRTGIYDMPNGHTVVALHILRVLFIQNQTTVLPLVRIGLTKPPAVIVDWYLHDEHNNHINSMYFYVILDIIVKTLSQIIEALRVILILTLLNWFKIVWRWNYILIRNRLHWI